LDLSLIEIREQEKKHIKDREQSNGHVIVVETNDKLELVKPDTDLTKSINKSQKIRLEFEKTDIERINEYLTEKINFAAEEIKIGNNEDLNLAEIKKLRAIKNSINEQLKNGNANEFECKADLIGQEFEIVKSGYLNGKIVKKDIENILVENNSVGYEIQKDNVKNFEDLKENAIQRVYVNDVNQIQQNYVLGKIVSKDRTENNEVKITLDRCFIGKEYFQSEFQENLEQINMDMNKTIKLNFSEERKQTMKGLSL
jgi:hypothetical protein